MRHTLKLYWYDLIAIRAWPSGEGWTRRPYTDRRQPGDDAPSRPGCEGERSGAETHSLLAAAAIFLQVMPLPEPPLWPRLLAPCRKGACE